jgi:hypothetical protein
VPPAAVTLRNVNFAHRSYFGALYDFHNKIGTFPQTLLTNWFCKEKHSEGPNF